MKWVVLDKFGKNIAVFKHFTLNYVFIFAMNFNEREFRKNFLIFNLITYKNDFYEEPIESFSNVFHYVICFCRAFGIAVSRKVYNVPALVDEEMVDEHGLSRCGRGHGKPFSPGQHIDETGFSYVGASDESIFGKCACGAFPHVCVTDDEFSVCNIHFVAFLGFYVWQR